MTKFNPAWQLARVKARQIRNYKEKLKYVLNYLENNPNKHDYARVHNWLKMTAVGYKSKVPDAAMTILNAADEIEANKDKYDAPSDNNSTLADLTYDEKRMILNDLEARKYGFQYKTTPEGHKRFVEELKKDLEKHRTS